MQQQINQLNTRISELEKLIKNNTGSGFEEQIRNIVLVDIDNTTSKTQTITIGAGGGSATVPKNPDTYLRVYFRGRVYNIPAYKII